MPKRSIYWPKCEIEIGMVLMLLVVLIRIWNKDCRLKICKGLVVGVLTDSL